MKRKINRECTNPSQNYNGGNDLILQENNLFD